MVTFCWGIAPVMVRYLTHHGVPDGFTSNLVRYPAAVMIYLPWLVAAARRGGLGRVWWTALIPTGFNLVGQTLWAWAPYYVEVGTMAFLLQMCSVWSILAAFVLFPDERKLARSPNFWFGAVLAIAGFVLMSHEHMVHVAQAPLAGVLIMLFCSLGYGLYYATVRYVIRDLHPLVVFGIIGSYTSVGLILMAPLGHPASVLRLEPWPLAILLASAVLGISIAHGLYYIAVQRIGVAVSALTLTATPFVSSIASQFLLHEQFSRGQWIGGLTLIGGAVLAMRSQQHLTCVERPNRLNKQSEAGRS